MRYTWAVRSDVGRVREANEDSIYPKGAGGPADELVAAVADGMGGHVGGEVASSLAISAVAELSDDPGAVVREANDRVVDRVIEQPRLAGMGTTLTMGAFRPDGTLDLAHIGDSRAYVMRDEDLRQVTSDHSVVAELVARGQLSERDAEHHPYRSVITRAIGIASEPSPDAVQEGLEAGDRILLCSDGLTDMVEDRVIGSILGAAETPQEAVDDLVAAANDRGGMDNISVVVVFAIGDTPN